MLMKMNTKMKMKKFRRTKKIWRTTEFRRMQKFPWMMKFWRTTEFRRTKKFLWTILKMMRN